MNPCHLDVPTEAFLASLGPSQALQQTLHSSAVNLFRLTQAEYESRSNSWASAATEYCRRGYPVHYEGIDWQQACRDHGFYGAIQKVKEAHRRRKQQQA